MKITANIATYPPRAESLRKMLKSIEGQFDEVRICFNGYSEIEMNNFCDTHNVEGFVNVKGIDYTDNGKFYALDIITEPEYYFTLDDDLIYPPNYVQSTIKAIQRYGCIVTHHGRVLNGEGLDYYYAHQAYRCLDDVHQSIMLDVAGTGVTAFDTRYFHPKGLADRPDKLMSDLVFSLEAAKQGKVIGIPSHDRGWIKQIKNRQTIFDTCEIKGYQRQNEIADEIWKLKYRQQ